MAHKSSDMIFTTIQCKIFTTKINCNVKLLMPIILQIYVNLHNEWIHTSLVVPAHELTTLIAYAKKLFVAFPWVVTSTGPGGFMDMCVFYDGNSLRLNRKWFYGEAGNQTCDPWFTKHSAYLLHHGGLMNFHNFQILNFIISFFKMCSMPKIHITISSLNGQSSLDKI